jgi:hypothetical protein
MAILPVERKENLELDEMVVEQLKQSPFENLQVYIQPYVLNLLQAKTNIILGIRKLLDPLRPFGFIYMTQKRIIDSLKHQKQKDFDLRPAPIRYLLDKIQTDSKKPKISSGKLRKQLRTSKTTKQGAGITEPKAKPIFVITKAQVIVIAIGLCSLVLLSLWSYLNLTTLIVVLVPTMIALFSINTTPGGKKKQQLKKAGKDRKWEY